MQCFRLDSQYTKIIDRTPEAARIFQALFFLVLLVVSGCSLTGEMSTPSETRKSGRQIALEIRGLGLQAREESVFAEILAGNTPSWFLEYQSIEITRELNGKMYKIGLHVSPDYVTVGTDEDPLLIPLSPRTAQKIADHFGASLPTSLLVDAIWQKASVRLTPSPIPPSPQMTTLPVFEDHNRTVRAQFATSGLPNGSLVAGHKKDVVLTSRLDNLVGKVAIYGWHQPDGQPIQPLYTGHSESWVDYSHGIRLIDRTVFIDGTMYDITEILTDPAMAFLLNSEGVIRTPRYPASN